MIPTFPERTVHSDGITMRKKFGISDEHSAHIMSILRDQMYSDKIMAVLREYSANAMDANASNGKADVPIRVRLPTHTDPTLTIRDFGPGMTVEEIETIFTQYGASTKRDSNDYVGMLGIGSKSGFAYSDSFMVTSWCEGRQRVYSAVIDESQCGAIMLLSDEPSAEETGIQISLVVKPSDIRTFEEKASILYRYFKPQPDINCYIAPLPQTTIDVDGIGWMAKGDYNTHGKWVAIMGCIPYPIDIGQITCDLPPFVSRSTGALYFNVGDVDIAASRESLKYSDKTIEAISTAIEMMNLSYVDRVVEKLEGSEITDWERLIIKKETVDLGFVLPTKHQIKDLWGVTLDLIEKDNLNISISFGDKFNPSSLKRSITINRDAKILLYDCGRSKKGFHGSVYSYHEVSMMKGASKERALEYLNKRLKACGMEGLPVKLSSTMMWTPPPKSKRVNSDKYKLSCFEFTPTSSPYRFSRPYSNYWQVIDHTPSDSDVYVEISSFETSPFDIYMLYSLDDKLAKIAGVKMPKIIGYKLKKGQATKKRKGTKYDEYRVEWAKNILKDPVMQKMYVIGFWNSISMGYGSATPFKEYEKFLGANHPVVEFLSDLNKNRSEYLRKSYDERAKVDTVYSYAKSLNIDPPYQAFIDLIAAKYPMFNVMNGITSFTSKDENVVKTISDYILLCEKEGT